MVVVVSSSMEKQGIEKRKRKREEEEAEEAGEMKREEVSSEDGKEGDQIACECSEDTFYFMVGEGIAFIGYIENHLSLSVLGSLFGQSCGEHWVNGTWDWYSSRRSAWSLWSKLDSSNKRKLVSWYKNYLENK